jgi:hypothetical protein
MRGTLPYVDTLKVNLKEFLKKDFPMLTWKRSGVGMMATRGWESLFIIP